MFARRWTHLQNSTASDQVVLGWSLPSDTVVHKMTAEIHCWSPSQLSASQSTMYACEAYILPVFDPDAVQTYDALWDRLVPKDTDTQTMDLDTGAADSSPMFEPGEPDWTNLFDVGVRPKKLFSRYKLITPNNPMHKFNDTETPFAFKWFPGDIFKIRISPKMRVKQPSVLVVGFGSPALDDTTTSVPGALLENEWPRIKYGSEMLRRAMSHLLGLVEAGAETPWEEATALLVKHLEPDIFEETAATMIATQFEVAAVGMLDHSVVGDLGKVSVSTGR